MCSAKKSPTRRNRALQQLYSVGAPTERVAVDIAGPLPLKHLGNRYTCAVMDYCTKRVAVDTAGLLPLKPLGNRYTCVVMDYCTKWPETYALPIHEAETTAGLLMNEFFTSFGVPAEQYSGQCREFESRLFRECCQLFKVRKTRTTPLHPQSDGMVERYIRTFAQQLTKYCEAGQ